MHLILNLGLFIFKESLSLSLLFIECLAFLNGVAVE